MAADTVGGRRYPGTKVNVHIAVPSDAGAPARQSSQEPS